MKGHEMKHHMKKAHGGKADGDEAYNGPEPKPYNAQGSHVEHEAEEKGHGGHVKKKHKFAHGGHVDGEHGKKRLDRAHGGRTMKKARGGGAGSDMNPLTSASKVHDATGHSATEGDARRQIP